MPRRFCGIWEPSLITLHVVADTIIWLAYLWIPLVMLWAWRRGGKVLRLPTPLLFIVLLYALFITACGWTHFFDALMFYNPAYRINGLVRAFTAIVSLATAVSLVRLVPQAMSAPVTILTQQATLRQQYEWLRDILDSATGGVLKLCRTEAELPDAIGSNPKTAEITSAGQLRRARQLVQEMALRADFDEERAGELLTSVHEAVMNALKHGGGASVRAYASDDAVQVWIADNGTGIPLDKLPLATLKQGYSTAGTAGQGWFMLLSFVDRADLFTGPDGTCLVLEMKRQAGAKQVPFATAVGGDIQR